MPACRRPTVAQERALWQSDPLLEQAARRVGPYPGLPRPRDARRSHFEYLVRAICYQQISRVAAQAVWQRMVALTAGPRLAAPPRLLAIGATRMGEAGLTRPKQRAVMDLVRRIEDRSLPLRSLSFMTDEAVLQALTEVHGIGPWTAQIFLMFKLGRLDVLPAADIGLQEGLRLLDGLAKRPSQRELQQRAERWAPLRSVASWLLWELVHAEEQQTAGDGG